ncbi:hypothetical protein ES708_11119 [subsurface metagenome]
MDKEKSSSQSGDKQKLPTPEQQLNDADSNLVDLIKDEDLVPVSKQSKKIMDRKASDNKYLHKDFHISQNILMDYIYRNFGANALISYLEQYATAYYKPLKQKLQSGDFNALLNYITDIYKTEEWPITITSGENYMEIEQDACPGISHITASGGKPCPNYRETYHTIYKTLCQDTPFEYTLKFFNDDTGACKQLFIRKEINQ